MNRRAMLRRTGAAALALGLSPFPLGWTAQANAPKRRLLMFTRSEGFEHDVVRRRDGKLSLAETLVTELGAKHGFEVECTKDGRVFLPENLAKYDAFLFQTQGDLLREKSRDGQPPMLPEGKRALLQAIAGGKGFVGCHCASDTFHSAGRRFQTQSPDQVDPYIAMIGGEFIRHGAQQRAWMRVVDNAFPGLKGIGDFGLREEWYGLKNFAPDLHVLLVQETQGMTGPDYQRPDFPATWARMHQQGRVFYTSMGHRDDVWTNPLFQQILLGGLAWAVGNVNADITPNLPKAAPQAQELPKEPPPKTK
jgi:type 1 glutamine amidotransferase